ncbi:hypothetical protein P691DRAFT_801745 [Macrolepiota fuliginosa MF-IS2]|uniref:Uncharacterized protein n=1 Tax=Macrolepiota fuliginosa MF-IS2 TaxID=1400762 RepID=A0A9P5XE36_9AGAR|nr:hypothetical protein P691DRAFT_801745 [Macrolepiota fuliginosa MF-IS2]
MVLLWLLVILLFPFPVITVILSLGAPCWNYRDYQRHQATGDGQGSTGDVWRGVLQQAQRQWKIYHALSMIVIPTTVRHFVRPAEECSWSYYLAVIALLSGTMNLALATVYKEYVEILQQPSVARHWLGERSGPRQPPGKAIILWIFLSIPASWFTCSIVASALSMVFSTWSGVAPGMVGVSCSTGHPYFQHTAIVIVASKAFADILFVVLTLQDIEYHAD